MCCNKANLAFILNESIPTPAMQPTAAPASPLPAFSLQSASSAPSSPAMQMPMPVRYPTITPRDAEIRMTMKQHLASFKRLAICDLLSPEPTYKVSLPTVVATSAPTTPTTNSAPTMPKRRKVVNCQVPDCKSRALTRKLCMRHGGGSRCQFPGCTNGAKLRNLCFQHGGSTTCMVPECDNIAKRFGYCWTHGGAYVCSAPNCKKFAAQGGLCWAHGGGNRCGFEGCTKRSYKQYDYRCKEHAKATTA